MPGWWVCVESCGFNLLAVAWHFATECIRVERGKVHHDSPNLMNQDVVYGVISIFTSGVSIAGLLEFRRNSSSCFCSVHS